MMAPESEGAGFVADASVTLPWCFEDEATPETEALLERLRAGEPAIAPAHWAHRGYEWPHRGRAPGPDRFPTGHSVCSRLKPHCRFGSSTPRASRLACRDPKWPSGIGLTVYDAAYLELAERTGLPSPVSTAICERRRWPQALSCWKRERPIAGFFTLNRRRRHLWNGRWSGPACGRPD